MRRAWLLLLAGCRVAGAARLADAPRPTGLPADLARHVLGLLPRPLLAAACPGSREVTLWRGTRSALSKLHVLSHSADVTEVRIFPEGDRVLALSEDGLLAIWGVASGRSLATFDRDRRDPARVFDLRHFPDVARVLVLGVDGATVYDAATGEVAVHLAGAEVGRHCAARVLPCGGVVVTGVSYLDGDPVVLRDVASGRALRRLAHEERVAAIDAGGGAVATASPLDVRLWSVDTGELRRRLPAPETGGHLLEEVVLSDETVAARTVDRVFVWDRATGRLRKTLADDDEFVSLAFASGGEELMASTHFGIGVFHVNGTLARWLDARSLRLSGRLSLSADGAVAMDCGDERIDWRNLWWEGRHYLEDSDPVQSHLRAILWEASTPRVLSVVDAARFEQTRRTRLSCRTAVWEQPRW